MKALILYGGSDADSAGTSVHQMLREALSAKGWDLESKLLEEMRIHPCVGCFTCWLKTPGECAINDDARLVTMAMAKCDALIFLSPVTFGGYASLLKHAADRIIPTISPLFEWVGGEMHHKLRYPAYNFFAIGWQREPAAESAMVFTKLAARNAINMHAPTSGSRVFHGGQSPAEQRAQVEQMIAGLERLL